MAGRWGTQQKKSVKNQFGTRRSKEPGIYGGDCVEKTGNVTPVCPFCRRVRMVEMPSGFVCPVCKAEIPVNVDREEQLCYYDCDKHFKYRKDGLQ